MPAKLYLAPTIHSEKIKTVNLGKTTQLYTNKEIGKAVKMTGPDTYELAADGDPIEGIITSSNYSDTGATRGGMSVGGIVCSGYFEVVSTGVLAANDIVVCGVQAAFGTVQAGIGPGDIPATVVKKHATMTLATATGPFLARIVGLGKVGTGAAGTVCVAEFL